MKLKELPNTVDTINLKLKLTKELYKAYTDCYDRVNSDEIYLVGPVMGDWFISPDPPGKGNRSFRALWPMPLSVVPSNFLECEIID